MDATLTVSLDEESKTILRDLTQALLNLQGAEVPGPTSTKTAPADDTADDTAADEAAKAKKAAAAQKRADAKAAKDAAAAKAKADAEATAAAAEASTPEGGEGVTRDTLAALGKQVLTNPALGKQAFVKAMGEASDGATSITALPDTAYAKAAGILQGLLDGQSGDDGLL